MKGLILLILIISKSTGCLRISNQYNIKEQEKICSDCFIMFKVPIIDCRTNLKGVLESCQYYINKCRRVQCVDLQGREFLGYRADE